MTSGSSSKEAALWMALLALGLTLLVVHNLAWYEFISNGFPNKGEDYYKTEGAVLREHSSRGLFLIIGKPLSLWFIISFTTLTLVPHERIIFRLIAGSALCYLFLILLYAGVKSYELFRGTFDNAERVISISSAGIARVLGIALGGWLAVRIDAFGRMNAMLTRTDYERRIHQFR